MENVNNILNRIIEEDKLVRPDSPTPEQAADPDFPPCDRWLSYAVWALERLLENRLLCEEENVKVVKMVQDIIERMEDWDNLRGHDNVCEVILIAFEHVLEEARKDRNLMSISIYGHINSLKSPLIIHGS